MLTAMSGDPTLLNNFKEGLDMYATLGSKVYKNDYWDNMEHFKDGTKNEEGAKRRKKMKVLYLGITYGMGPNKLAESLKCSKEEAKQIIEDFYAGFPTVKEWMDKTKEDARKNGYVEDFWGRKRHLNDLLLDEYEFRSMESEKFNPLLFTHSRNKEIDNSVKLEYLDRIKKCRSLSDRDSVIAAAKRNNIIIKQNGGFISDAERQCVNARVQGSAATMTKKAMVKIANDPVMKRIGFRLLIAVHDELIGEVKECFAEEAAERLTFLMKEAASDVPCSFKCDAEIEDHWYLNEYSASLIKENSGYIKEGKTEEEAFNILCHKHTESTEDFLKDCLSRDV